MKEYIFITGAAGGLGKSFSAECAQRGWNIFLTDLSETALASLAGGLRTAYGTDVIYRACDLTDAAERTELYAELKKSGLRFRGLINVAGLDFEGPFVEKTRDQIRTVLRLNIEATLDVTHEILELRAKGRPYRVITVSSLAAYYPMPVKAMYAASKRFLLDFSLALREEIRHFGGTVTVLCPAGMPTNEACIKAIDAQGFLGRITTKNTGFVAARTIDHALKGHAIYIPGRLNQTIRFIGNLLPPRMIARMVGRRWGAVRHKDAEALVV
jgi:short-subunit dehydrogenase